MAGSGSGGKVSRPRPRRVDINLEFDSLAALREYMTNISSTGCFIKAQTPWPVGTKLNLKFTVLLDDPEIFEGVGEVVRISERPRGVGVKFLELPEGSRRVIESVLTRPATKRPPR